MSTAETAFTVMSVGCLFVIGLGLGAASTTEDFKKALAKPKAVAIGFASQYVFMPVFAYILTLIFGIDEYIAIGCVLVGASPGGTTSNIFTYWSKGDTALSITMSLMSTTAAFFMMPFWIWLLVVVAFDSDAEIAWTNIVVSLLLIIIPTLIGLATRYYNTETIGRRLEANSSGNGSRSALASSGSSFWCPHSSYLLSYTRTFSLLLHGPFGSWRASFSQWPAYLAIG